MVHWSHRVADALGEVERGLHAQVLARLDIDVPAIRVWGDEYRRIGRAESDYHTLAGTVRVMRTVYRKTERNGDALDPMPLGAGEVRLRTSARSPVWRARWRAWWRRAIGRDRRRG
jgi:hypothetical protein